jgi:hypothetical protein
MPDQATDSPGARLADAKGPIPEFPPARIDPETGQLLPISEDELAARRDAALRTLRAIAEMTDETDTDERWEDFMRGYDESHPRRPQFEGMY